MNVEVHYYQEPELKIWKKSLWLDGVDPMVNSVGGVGVDDSEGVKVGAEKTIMGGDLKGKIVVYPLKPGEHHVIGKKRHMKVACHTWLSNRGKK